MGVGTYVGVRVLVFRYVPELVETQLQKITKRDVKVGRVQYLSPFLTRVEIGKTTILPGKEETAGGKPRDRAEITIPEIEVGFNLFPLVAKKREKQPEPRSINSWKPLLQPKALSLPGFRVRVLTR